jgi:hypothetical protein
MSDSIHIGSLDREAYIAIRDFSELQGWPEIHAWVEPQDLLLLIERLKRTPDTQAVFPMGKWATIHEMLEIFAKGFTMD